MIKSPESIEYTPSLNDLLAIVSSHKKIIVAPLDWGLGHATRCIPIIDFLLKHDVEVIIAAENGPLDIMRKQFPDLTCFQLDAKSIHYQSSSMILNMLLQAQKLTRNYHNDRKSANHIAKLTGATCIISDNRFGFYSSSTINVYITHQINIHHKIRIFSTFASWLHRRIMYNYDSIVIPDYKGSDSLAGQLSRTNLPNTTYIGPVTRIQVNAKPICYDVAIILSGVEPARTIFEAQLLAILHQITMLKIVLVRGTNRALEASIILDKISNLHIIDIADTDTISDILNTSQLLLTRPGYTTLMDINQLPISAIFIPTPGQTEQEYLASYTIKDIRYHYLSQDKLEKLPNLITTILAPKN